LYFWGKVQEGLRQADAGELIPHEEMAREFGGIGGLANQAEFQQVQHQPEESANRVCPKCCKSLPIGCYRKGAKLCVWCDYADKSKRAKARFRDKLKLAKRRVNISLEAFVDWYVAQDDRCAYCGLTFNELRTLQIKRGGGYCVAWDIDRIDSTKMYEPNNLALSCFVCNMAKGDMLTAEEAKEIGRSVRRIWLARLKERVRRNLMVGKP
jgi:hypothetical protein